MRNPLVIGNWKMNGSRRFIAQLQESVVQGLDRDASVEIVVCPPFVYLGEMAQRLAGIGLRVGAQHVSEYESGAYTGEVAVAMLAEVGCRYVLVGHSERRALFGADDARVARQFAMVVGAGLTPVLCIGEDAVQRGAGQTWPTLRNQLAAVGLIGSGEVPPEMRGAVIAYEPIWAIGTGNAATSVDAQAVHGRIRQELGAGGEQVRILYGGSVTAENAAELLAQPDIDGVLVGGASLRAPEFVAICALAALA